MPQQRFPNQCVIAVAKSQLIKRFDRNGPYRLHFASARTMLIAEGINESTMGYPDLADVARRLSWDPKRDCEQLFRRMLLNILIENTDDHEKNHAFLYQKKSWRLSPAYDFQPQLLGIGYHQLRIGKQGHVPAVSNALSEANRFLLKAVAAEKITAEILEQCRQWKTVFSNAGVTQPTIDLCANYVLKPSLLG